MTKDKIGVNISKDLYELAKQKVRKSNGEFKDVGDYVSFVLREVMKEDEIEEQVSNTEVEEKIKERLKSLGYM